MAWGTVEIPDLPGLDDIGPKPVTPTIRRRRFKPETERHRADAQKLFDNEDDVDSYLEQLEQDSIAQQAPRTTLRGSLLRSRGQEDTTAPAFFDPAEATREADRATSNDPKVLLDRALRRTQQYAGDVGEAAGSVIPDFNVRRPGFFGQDLNLRREGEDGEEEPLPDVVHVKPASIGRFAGESAVPGSTEEALLQFGLPVAGAGLGAGARATFRGLKGADEAAGLASVAERAGSKSLIPKVGLGIEDVDEESLNAFERLMQQSMENITAKGKAGAQQDFKAAAEETAKGMAEDRAFKATQYAEATEQSKRVAAMTGENPDAVRRRAVSQTKTGLDAAKKSITQRMEDLNKLLSGEAGAVGDAGEVRRIEEGLQARREGSALPEDVAQGRTRGESPARVGAEQTPIPPERFYGTDQPELGRVPTPENVTSPAANPLTLNQQRLEQASATGQPMQPRTPALGGDEVPIEAGITPTLTSEQPVLPGLKRPIQPNDAPVAIDAYHQPQLIGNEDHNGIIEAFKTSLAGKAKELKSSGGGIRSITSRIGGDLEDPYLAEMVNSESGLRHELIRQSTKDLQPINLQGLSADAQAEAVQNLQSQLESIIKEADEGVVRFRNDALDSRYGNTADRSIAHGTLVARDAQLAEQVPNKFDTAQGILKELTLGADLGVTLQQGLKAARVGSTSLVSSALGHGVEKIATVLGKDPQALGLYPDQAISAQAQRAADGLIERGAEAVGISRGEVAGSGVNRGTVGNIKNALLPAGENRVKSAVKAPIRVAGAGVQKLTDVQYAALNKVRVQVYEGRLYQAKLLGQDISPGSQARRAAAEFANLATSTARTASDAGRALVERRVLLTPQMTRSQFAELAQPLKTLQSPSQALNTANQLLSTTAMFATAYALNEQFGVTSGVDNFMSNTANPMSPNFGKITLKARDKDGNHIVWNFLPQFSVANAGLKSLRATVDLAKGDKGSRQALDQVANSLGSFGIGRLNSGLSDLTKLGGFGYDQDGRFHWGDMPVEARAKGVAPIPLSAQQSLIQGDTDPVSIGANILGGNVYGERPYGALDRAAQAEGYEDFNAAPPMVQNRLKKDPEVQRALEANPSEYKQAQARQESQSEEIQAAKRAEEQFATKPPEKPLRDIWHDEGIAKKTIALGLTDQFAKQFAGFNKSKYEKAVEGYYAVEKRTDQGNIDFDATQAAREDFLASLPADQQEWINQSLQVSRENKTPLHKEYLDYIDAKKALGYYREDITPAERSAIDKAHPELDVQSWKFGATKDQAGPALQTDKAVSEALKLKLPNRPVKRDGLSRPVNETPQTLRAWDLSKAPVQFYLDAGGTQNLNAYALDEFGVPYAKLNDANKAKISSAVKRDLREDPEIEAWLVFWGLGTMKASSEESAARLTQLYRQYGTPKK